MKIRRPAVIHVLALSLVVVCVGTAAHSVDRAQWVTAGGRYTGALWLGAAAGLALAATRWPGRRAAAYSLTLGLAAAGEAAARLLPDPATLGALSWPALVLGLNVRALTFGDQAVGWLATLATGGVVRDQGLFILLAGFGLWQAGAWLAWDVFRRRSALAGLLPLTAILSLNSYLADRPAGELAVVLITGLGLLALTAYHRARVDWERRGVEYAEAIAPDWAFGQTPVMIILTMLVVTAPYTGTPLGWSLLTGYWRTASQQTADAAGRLFGGVNPPRAAALPVGARLPDLERIGRPLPEGAETVMWVWLSDPAPPTEIPDVVSAPGTGDYRRHYWRSQVYVAYTGAGWEAVRPAAADPPAGPLPGRYALDQLYLITAAHGPELFAVNVPISATGATLAGLPAGAPDALVQGSGSEYRVTSWAVTASGAALARAGVDYPAEVRATYLQLPAGLPERVRAMAARLAEGVATPYVLAVRVQDYLRAAYRYQRDAPLPPAGRDSVDYFLFDAPGGFCTYYASAMTVLLRAQGVPARVAAGFAMGEYDAERGAWRVPAGAAHAWVEVYFPGWGWVEFEPTPVQARPDYGGLTAEAPAPRPALEPAAKPAFDWRPALGLAAAGLLAALLVWQWRRSRAGPPAAQTLYWRVRRSLARAGLTAPPNATPAEYRAASAAALSHQPRLWAALESVTQLYEATEYAERPASAAALRAAADAWARARGERWRLDGQRWLAWIHARKPGTRAAPLRP